MSNNSPANSDQDQCGFGLEVELLLVRSSSSSPLLCTDLKFEELLDLIDSIDTSDIAIDGLNVKPLHRKPSHYLVEGYTLTDDRMRPVDLLPKGVEIRTPVYHSIDAVLDCVAVLEERLQQRLRAAGMSAVVLGHHPTAVDLQAPPNYERHDYWQWALVATSTYGPDINISLPEPVGKRVDLKKLSARVNYYLPALAALSLNSPLYLGDLWRVRGEIGKSVRTFRRSVYAPIHYIHEKPSLRFEFKAFEMASCLDDYAAYFLCSMALLLDDELVGEASDQERIYDLGRIAVEGLQLEWVRERCRVVLDSSRRIAGELGYDAVCLDEMYRRLQEIWVPADGVIGSFERTASVESVLRELPAFSRAARTVCLQ